MRIWMCVCLLLVLIVVGSLQAKLNFQIEKTVLENGLTVLTIEDHTFHTISYQTFVNAGSRDEIKPGATGIAHVFEHMMFRGTPAHPDFDDAILSMGAQVNAYTGEDYTCYYLNARAKFLTEIIPLEADRIRNLQFTNEAFRRELGPIKEERRRFSVDDAGGFLGEMISKLAYQKHTYGHPVIGWGEDLETSLTFADAADFKARFYAPNNVTIIIAGDFDTQAALSLVRKYYADWNPSTLPPEKIIPEPLQSAERVQQYTWKSSEIPAKLALAYHGPRLNFSDNDFLGLQVLAQVLFSRTGALYKTLKDRLDLVETVGGNMQGQKDPSLFLIQADLRNPQYRDSVLHIITAEIDRIKIEGIKKPEFERAVNNLKADFIYRLDRPSHIVGTVGYYQMVGGDYNLIFAYMDKLSDLTVNDLTNAANKYLILSNCSVVTLFPKDTK